jgi:hypothetical protein
MSAFRNVDSWNFSVSAKILSISVSTLFISRSKVGDPGLGTAHGVIHRALQLLIVCCFANGFINCLMSGWPTCASIARTTSVNGFAEATLNLSTVICLIVTSISFIRFRIVC